MKVSVFLASGTTITIEEVFWSHTTKSGLLMIRHHLNGAEYHGTTFAHGQWVYYDKEDSYAAR